MLVNSEESTLCHARLENITHRLKKYFMFAAAAGLAAGTLYSLDNDNKKAAGILSIAAMASFMGGRILNRKEETVLNPRLDSLEAQYRAKHGPNMTA